jgi:TonB family protein
MSDPDLPKAGFGSYNFSPLIESSRTNFPIGGMEAVYENLEYPKLLEEMGIGGSFMIMVRVEMDGSPGSVRIMSYGDKYKYYELEEAACKAVGKAKWEPAMYKDLPIATISYLRFDFISVKAIQANEQIPNENDSLLSGLPVDPPYPLPNASWEDLNERAIKKAGREAKGYTVIRTYIDRTGTVLKTQSIWPRAKTPEWDEAAISVIKNTKFKPAMLRGEIPVGVWFNIPVIFKLNK